MRAFISAFAHTYHCIDEKHHAICWRIDFVVTILSSAYASVDYLLFIFHCESSTMRFMIVFAWTAFTVSTLHTAASTKNMQIRDATIGIFLFFSMFGIYAYQTFLVFVIYPGDGINFPINIWICWTMAVIFLLVAALVRSLEWPEKFVNNKIIDQVAQKQLQQVSDNVRNVIENNETGRERGGSGSGATDEEEESKSQEGSVRVHENAPEIMPNTEAAADGKKQGNSDNEDDGAQLGVEDALVNYVFSSHQWWHILMHGMTMSMWLSVVYYTQYVESDGVCD